MINTEFFSKNLGSLLAVIAVLAVFTVLAASRLTESAPTKTVEIGAVQVQAEIADNIFTQAHGLAGRVSLCDTCGMLFIFSSAGPRRFWMAGMKFPLDMIFINHGQVTEIYPNVPAPQSGQPVAQIQSQQSADQVLEVNAGFAEKFGITIGDPAAVQ